MLAEKPGNVSPTHSFNNANVDDFLKSADAIAPVLATAAERPLGAVIKDAVVATQQVVGHNTNLGIILLLAPLCAVRDWHNAKSELANLLTKTTVQDAVNLYEAIRIAAPGGLGDAPKQDVASAPTMTLLECMQLAADRDAIASEYCSGFNIAFNVGLRRLLKTSSWQQHHQHRLGWLAVQLLALQSDSLIARKCGQEVANTVQDLADATVAQNWPFGSNTSNYSKLKAFLVADGHNRNPGTTADLIAAILFCGLRSGDITYNDDQTHMLFRNPQS